MRILRWYKWHQSKRQI
uniref:Uncharacterized protein n=1 Tax=Vitis vinifera TaxID=29760 RepID=F6I6S0_VITVI